MAGEYKESRQRSTPNFLFHNLNQAGGGFLEITANRMLGRTRTMSGWSNGLSISITTGRRICFVARGNVLDNVSMFSDRSYEEPTPSSAISATASFRT